MPRFPEPCLCGAPDCPRCFPLTWRRAKAEPAYEHYCVERERMNLPVETFESWFARQEHLREEQEELAWEERKLERGW